MLKASKMTIMENEFVTVWYHADKKIVHHQFHKFIHGKVLRDALDAGYEVLKKYKAQKWLSDDRLNSAIPKEDTEWAFTDWSNRVIQAGWKFWAIVQPESVIGQMNVKRFAKEYLSRGVVVEMFTDPDNAMKWLEKQ